MTSAIDFDAMFSESDDPWGFRSRWYERRKRDILLAMLPRERFASAYEPGCANGELSFHLAQRCDRLLVSDISPRAVALARQKLAAVPGAEAVQAVLPRQWPASAFDLIVISEMGYYLSPADLAMLADRARNSLTADGVVVSCHWRHAIDGCELSGDQVDAMLEARLQFPRLAQVLELDFRLSVWCRDPRSVGMNEGLVQKASEG